MKKGGFLGGQTYFKLNTVSARYYSSKHGQPNGRGNLLKDDTDYHGNIQQNSCLAFLFTLHMVKIIHLHKYLEATEKDMVLSLYG